MKIIREKSLEELKNYVFNAVDGKKIPEEYESKDTWINQFFKNEMWSVEIEKKLYDLPETIQLSNGGFENDIANIKIIHGALKDFSPRILTSEQIWVYLTHKTFYDYMVSRWDPMKASIKDRYFLSGSNTRTLSRNGISRLWFLGHLSYDSNLENPYEITEMLMSKQDIMAEIVERPTISMNKIFFNALVKLIYKKDLTREAYRDLMIRCNRVSGISRFDTYNQDEMERFLASMIEG